MILLLPINALILFIPVVRCVSPSEEDQSKLYCQPSSHSSFPAHSGKIAIVGEGVIGLSTAMAIKELQPDAEVHIYHHVPFNDTLSVNIAGLFRVDKRQYKVYGKETFDRLAMLWRKHGGVSGVQLVSGHILSHDMESLKQQEENYGDIVYNFRYMQRWEMESQFGIDKEDTSSAIHYTAFTSEGASYCPWMRKELEEMGVQFHQKLLGRLDELADDGYKTVINCAGIKGGDLSGDDNTVYPIRGILLRVKAPWQKHFLYRDFSTFTIPVIDGVAIGTVKEDHQISTNVTKEEEEEILARYAKLQPAMGKVEVLTRFAGHRPGRDYIRVEKKTIKSFSGKEYTAVHNYGHGGNGFTLGWGSAMHAASLALGRDVQRYLPTLPPKSRPSCPTTSTGHRHFSFITSISLFLPILLTV